MRIVVALGGNALLRRGEPMTAAVQNGNVSRAAAALAPLIRAGHRVAITHGNGPQIGLLALQSGTSDDPYPLDILGAETDGMIGYLLQRELANRLPPEHLVTTMLTQVRVDPDDPAFAEPTKPIGPTYDEATARQIGESRGWTMGRDGRGWRRMVPSPQPLDILEARVIEILIDRGVTVICGGGGGIPVAEAETGELTGIECVVDKDTCSALIARLLRADRLLLLTDADAVYSGWGTAQQARIATLSARTTDPADFPAGSMRPKVEAAMSFASETGHPAAIGALEDIAALLTEEKGTTVVP